MQLKNLYPVEFRLGLANNTEMASGLGDETFEYEVPVVQSMTLDLQSPDDAFKITGKAASQLVIKKRKHYATWKWGVTPQQRGKHTLALRLSSAVKDDNGQVVEDVLQDQTILIDVRVGWFATRSALTKWTIRVVGLACSALGGAIIKDPAAALENFTDLMDWLHSMIG